MATKRNEIAAGQFKTHCLQLIDEVNKKHTSVIITKHGKPMAKLIPFEQAPESLFGCLKNTVVIHGDIIHGTGEEWDVEK